MSFENENNSMFNLGKVDPAKLEQLVVGDVVMRTEDDGTRSLYRKNKKLSPEEVQMLYNKYFEKE